MSEVKLYKYNNDNETVAAAPFGKEDGKWYRIFSYNCLGMPTDGLEIKACKFYKEYTPLPEAPEVGSTAWAVWMMQQGHKVTRKSFSKKNFWHLNKRGDIVNVEERDCSIRRMHNDWQLYEEPIVELLLHEFVPGQEVLCRYKNTVVWLRGTYQGMSGDNAYLCRCDMPKDKKYQYDYTYFYCLPYAENAHLEGQITDGEHGAVPKGYVPPHVPQLGDDDYWQVGDEVVDLAEFYSTRIITHVFENHIVTKHSEDSSLITYYTKNGCFIDASNMRDCGTLRVLYHDTSYVRDDGTVHEFIPTRPHKKIDTETDGE